MSSLPSLEEIDRDGALQETAQAAGSSRGDFLRRAAVTGGAFAGAGSLLAAIPSVASAAVSGHDKDILNFALTLEYLEATFYAEAVKSGALSGRTLQFARVVAAHEAAHVKALKAVLGRSAVAKPRFNFHGTTSNQAKFQKTAIALEDTGVGAYKGQAPLIQEVSILKAALSIHTVEARHAAWIRHIAGVAPAPHAFDKPLTKSQVLAIVQATHFIAAATSRPPSSRSPSFTG